MMHDDRSSASPAWERWRDFRGFFVTIRQFYYDSGITFERMAADGPPGRALAFLLSAKLFNQVLWVLLLWFYFFSLPQLAILTKNKPWVLPSPGTTVLIVTIGVPCFEAALGLFLTGLARLFFIGKNGRGISFSLTLRVLCYSMGMASFLCLIPCAGPFAAAAYFGALCHKGFDRTHPALWRRTPLALLAVTAIYGLYLFVQQWFLLKFLWDFTGMKIS